MSETPFGQNEEQAIIALALDVPEFFSVVADHIESEHFQSAESKFIYEIIKQHWIKHDCLPTRRILHDIAAKKLTADDPAWEDIMEIIGRESDPREIPSIRSLLIDWARNRAFGRIYDEDSIDAYSRGDYERIESIIEAANRINNVSDSSGLWFFDEVDILFDKDVEEKLTTGFPKLDEVINEGGPTRADTFAWMAPTGVGKSILLVNSGVAAIRRGLNVLHVTLELSKKKTAERYMGAFTELPIKQKGNFEDKIRSTLSKIKKTYDAGLAIYEFPPDEISVDTIYSLVDWLRKTRSWTPEVIIVDYLELMLSRRAAINNQDEYGRQKRTATEIRGLAKKTNSLIFTATQTNRAGMGNGKGEGNGNIDLNKAAESYGKMMPLDYVVSINQSQSEYEQEVPRIRLFVAKNRNGKKHITIRAKINYGTMKVEEESYS